MSMIRYLSRKDIYLLAEVLKEAEALCRCRCPVFIHTIEYYATGARNYQ